MGKQKLKSSIKALQEAIISLKPMSPTCIQQARTNSFRDETALIEGSANRLFFSPCMTKSIMEEGRARAGSLDAATLENVEEATVGDLYNGSIVVVLASDDPFMDFKLSMEEMVKAHGMREWVQLEELLLCYLRLNERGNHKVIMMAFVELVKSIATDLRGGFPSSFLSSSSRPLCF